MSSDLINTSAILYSLTGRDEVALICVQNWGTKEREARRAEAGSGVLGEEGAASCTCIKSQL